MRYILDNVLVTHETITWAKELDLDMVLLKLDFMKVYNMVCLPFLWGVLQATRVPPFFIQLCKLLFVGVEASMNINGSETDRFSITRGVRQGCPLAPYLFLFIDEALNIATKRAQSFGSIQGITLPFDLGHQLIIQYVDNTNYTI